MSLPTLGIALLLQLSLLLSTPASAASLWGPVLGNVTPHSAKITWRDGEGSTGEVEFNGTRMTGENEHGYLTVTLTKLQPNTTYNYTFKTANKSTQYSFLTAPEGSTPFSFVAYGDTRTQLSIHSQVMSAIAIQKPRFIINTGDLVGEGPTAKDWDAFFQIAAPLTGSVPYYAATGNHEGNADYFINLFIRPNADATGNADRYAFVYGNMNIIVLNSTRNLAEQRVWLEQYLTAMAGKTTWTVVVFHYPPFSTSTRNGDDALRKSWVPVLEKYKVDVVFLGHDHFYERSEKNGVVYFITGGGGAPLYTPNLTPNPYKKINEKCYHFMRADVTATTLRLRMFHLDGSVGDDVVLKK